MEKMLQLQRYMNERQVKRSIMNNNEMRGNERKLVKKQFKVAGRLYAKKEYVSALMVYNEILSCVDDQDSLGYVYNRRSIIFKDFELYAECLNNINLAEERNIKYDLSERRELCLRAIAMQGDQSLVGPELALSYPANPKMPFVADCLKLMFCTVYGRTVYTDKDLKPGDIICIENLFFATMPHNYPFYHYNERNCSLQRCYHCLKFNNLDLIPCFYCNFAMFCSIKCREEAFVKYHKYECAINNAIPGVQNIVRKMRTFFMSLYLYFGDINAMRSDFEGIGTEMQSVFDYDLSKPSVINRDRRLMKIFHSCKTPRVNRYSAIFKNIFSSSPALARMWHGNEYFIVKFILRHADNLRDYGQVILDNSPILPMFNDPPFIEPVRQIIGVGYFPFSSLLKHSMIPNVSRRTTQTHQLVLTVCRHIKKGEMLFDDYK